MSLISPDKITPPRDTPRGNARSFGWRGASLVAITYIYFLIFAQFAFLKRLMMLDVAGDRLQAALAAMAAGGILFSLLTPRLRLWPLPNMRLRIGLGSAALAAFATLLPLGFAGCIALSFLIGAGLGVLTVTLVTHLRQWTGNRNPLFCVGLGTGIGYLICNFPPLFAAPPQVQAIIAGAACLMGMCITLSKPPPFIMEITEMQSQPSGFSFPYVLACFSALVWLDSAAFYIIQKTPTLKADTWAGAAHLWAIGLLHLAAALTSVGLLRKRGLWPVLSLAFFALCCACLLLLHPYRALPASIFYPIGASLYSVALVAYPSLLASVSSSAERCRQAGWLYAIAGWSASALGIGMSQNLGYIPPAFVLVAGVVILLPWVVRNLAR